MDKTTRRQVAKFIAPYRVDDGRRFRLKDVDPGDTRGLQSEFKDEARAFLQQSVGWLAEQQDMLYAQNRWAVLLIFQAMDAAGKDGTIKHVMSGVNPQGCHVTSFKAPTSTELDHDFLWRGAQALPERGRIGIHNRSWYEEVLVARVHPEILARQQLPQELVGKRIWKERFEDIVAYERHLARNGVAIRKFMLHVSKGEQRRRFLERLDVPEKHWKFSIQDVAEREHWDAYMEAYEGMIRATAAPHAPWFVVPADNKWFARLTVSLAIADSLVSLGLRYPEVDAAQLAGLKAARARLLAGGNGGNGGNGGKRRREP
jgi:PPK2 family polyphosphate:nucleotide phosphotransferase